VGVMAARDYVTLVHFLEFRWLRFTTCLEEIHKVRAPPATCYIDDLWLITCATISSTILLVLLPEPYLC